jgi:ubiquinone/menaquinone biosynthesis C-methylase UbiE
MFKNDIFSENSHKFVKFRPQYPSELYEFIYQNCKNFQNVWDCGTGNGQVAFHLADKFKNVFATDISEEQLQKAGRKPNIFYSIQQAEKTNLPNNFFDLITCGQSYHWFDVKKFVDEALRVSRKDSTFAIWGYFLPRIDSYNDKILDDFYNNVIYNYWEKESRFLEKAYKDVYFPFENMKYQRFEIREEWSKSHYFSYLSSWSFLKKFIKKNDFNPLVDLFLKLELPERFEICFTVFCKLGKIGG